MFLTVLLRLYSLHCRSFKMSKLFFIVFIIAILVSVTVVFSLFTNVYLLNVFQITTRDLFGKFIQSFIPIFLKIILPFLPNFWSQPFFLLTLLRNFLPCIGNISGLRLGLSLALLHHLIHFLIGSFNPGDLPLGPALGALFSSFCTHGTCIYYVVCKT